MRARGDAFVDGIGCLFFIALVVAAGWFGYRKWQDSVEAERAAAQARLEAVRAESRRRQALDDCLWTADRRYWDYVKLNGREVKGEPGTWRAATHVWDTAAANKRNDVAECSILYGAK